ncbi:3-dehydroquinate synthase [Olleya sp. Bg11-27]|uniref:3-dehydroquinate synthase n=1 Tax=Olleya sp. Bg11-27 TaxID=2058135 RepID=UPI000C316216|nr:3-dehydroquinate synthase [Olleya sp. Bg11-27]AUC76640.1 3-dehydroquinate synthase [Olleya sp. Bg11-27]
MTSIQTQDYSIQFNSDCSTALNTYIKEHSFSNIFILVDSNTYSHCLPKLLEQLETNLTIEIIEIEAGEHHKNIETCLGVWQTLSDLRADRKSLMINLGGGVVTDLGGFVACTYQRGIKFINIPTTLLSMVDASIGGKNGVDLGSIKNQIGIIKTPNMVLIDTDYLNTLSSREMRSGLAEMLKHGLIHNELYYNKLSGLSNLTLEDLDQLIYDSVLIKKDIVEQDPTEQNLRKTLNFGHTLGHAIESFYLNHETKALLHGEAIAIGMILETYLSTALLGFPLEKALKIKENTIKVYGKVAIPKADLAPIIDLMRFDKKNEKGTINFVLLETIGKAKTNCVVSNELIINSFDFYNE